MKENKQILFRPKLMPLHERANKTIVFYFTNAFTKKEIMTLKMPYVPFWATNGHYSSLYKRMKLSVAFKIDKSLVRGKKWFLSQETNRTIITYPNGVSLDMPFDINEKGIKIILHYLEGVKMSLSD